MVTVQYRTWTRKDNMRLFIILAVFLTVSRAKEIEKIKTENKEVEDSEAIASAASLELLREGTESLETAASTNKVLARQNQNPWNNYFPNQGQFGQIPQFPSSGQFGQIPQFPSGQFPSISQGQWGQNIPGNWFQPQKPQSDYVPPQNNPVPPQNNPVPPQNNYAPPENNYIPETNPPQNDYYRPPQNNYRPNPPQNNYRPNPPQNNYNPNPPQNNYNDPPKPEATTEAVTVIKNEQILGENGNYKFEYQMSDGTWVGEEGYIINPNTEYAELVKKGWYSYLGADGKQYTVTWWADKSGYHAFGDHLPKSPPIPPEIQAALDQAAKEEAAKAEAEKNKPQPQPQPQPGYPANKPQNYPQYDPPQQYPQPQPQYPPQQQYPQQQYPQQQNPQQQYPQQQNPQQQYPQHGNPQQQNPPSYRPPSYAKRGSRRFRMTDIAL